MKQILQSRNLWIAAVLWLGFWPVAVMMPRWALFDLMNSLVIAACLGVFIAYLPGVWRTIFRNDLDGAHYLVIGICGFALAQGCRFGWNWAWRYLGKPEYMQEHIFVAWLIWLSFTFACVHLMARGVIAGKIPGNNYRWMVLVITIGVASALFFIRFIEP